MAKIARIAGVLVLFGWLVASPQVAQAKDPLLAGGGGGYCYEPPPAMDAGWVAVGDNCFSPQGMDIVTGETVRWTLAGQGKHNITFDGGPYTDGIPADGFGITFRAPGTYQYFCSLHPGMTGTVTVTGDTLSGPALEVLGSPVGRPLPDQPTAAGPVSVLRDTVPMRLEFSPLTSVVLLTIGLPLSLGLAARFVGFRTTPARRPQARR